MTMGKAKDIYAPLDDEERELMRSVEEDEWIQSTDQALKASILHAASNSQKKNKSVTFRLTEHDFEAIRQRAAVDGIPYQTLISALVHQYALGKVKLNT
ncbi:MAG: antitoxin [SAR324 cluster bacterium]|nr:antitoxin [SAR324 cluster bacterium]